MDWAAMATESTVASAGVCLLVPGGVLTQCVFTLKRKVGPQLVEVTFNLMKPLSKLLHYSLGPKAEDIQRVTTTSQAVIRLSLGGGLQISFNFCFLLCLTCQATKL